MRINSYRSSAIVFSALLIDPFIKFRGSLSYGIFTFLRRLGEDTIVFAPNFRMGRE